MTPDLSTLLKLWDTAVWEFSLVFEDLSDEDVWRSPQAGVPSVGVQACHLARSENSSFGQSVESPLDIDGMGYFPYDPKAPLPIHLAAAEVFAEYERVHKAAIAWIHARGFALSDPYENPKFENHEGMTWGDRIEYMPFHVAYHTGQAYMARHIMGHDTTEN
ncbi:MAG: DinB family protein [Chthonomonas sp.]|nr:DinB family protein [Chthonomonas sp.]